MKASLLIDGLFSAGLTLGGEVFTMNINIKGNPKPWAGVLTPEECEQIRFAISRISNGEFSIGEAQDLLGEASLFGETIKRQVAALDELRKGIVEKDTALTTAVSERDALQTALENQKSVIDDLRAKLVNQTHGNIPVVEAVDEVVQS